MIRNENSLPARVFLVDDHPVVREGLAVQINCQPDLEVCGEADDAADAIKGIRESNPDVAIIDIHLKTGSGLDLIKRIKAGGVTLAMLAVSMHEEELYAERAIRAGALGFINKQEATHSIITAIQHILDGRIYLSERSTDRFLKQAQHGTEGLDKSPIQRLSDRELQVFQMIGEGISTRAIASRLHISHKTVENYRENIKGKLNLNDSTELMREAIMQQLGYP